MHFETASFARQTDSLLFEPWVFIFLFGLFSGVGICTWIKAFWGLML